MNQVTYHTCCLIDVNYTFYLTYLTCKKYKYITITNKCSCRSLFF